MTNAERYVVRRAENAWEVVDSETGEVVASYNVFMQSAARADAWSRNHPEN